MKPYEEQYLNAVKSQIYDIQRINGGGYNVRLISFCSEYGDDEITDKLYDNLTDLSNVERYYYRGNLSEITKLIAESEYMIGTRFHAIILGLVYDLKVLPISYSIKTENMLKSLGCWNEIYEFSAFCNSTSEELKNDYLHDVNIDSEKNVQFDWLDKFLV